jgi:ADP-heptose:LPS heptosyltransferase
MKSILFVLGGGIGNIVQATPSIILASNHGYKIDLCLHCNSSKDLNVFKLSCVENLYINENNLNKKYSYQLQGPFTKHLKSKALKVIKSRITYAQHIEESKVYKDLINQIGIDKPLPDVKINFGKKGTLPEKDSVAIYCGSKPDWAMKRWDKYDELSKNFENVLVVGTKLDIESHGNPSWIKKNWNWPKHVKFLTGPLQEVAFSISRCKMFIGNDGGLAHIAAATGIKTFVLFGPSSYIKNKPFSKNSYAIGINIPCRPCQFNLDNVFGSGKSGCPFNMRCMKEMSVEFVLKEIKKCLNE